LPRERRGREERERERRIKRERRREKERESVCVCACQRENVPQQFWRLLPLPRERGREERERREGKRRRQCTSVCVRVKKKTYLSNPGDCCSILLLIHEADAPKVGEQALVCVCV